MLITKPCGATCTSVTREGEGKKNTGLQKQALLSYIFRKARTRQAWSGRQA